MKRTQIIALLVVSWAIAIIAIFIGVNNFIDKKKITLRNELRDNISDLFQGQSSGGMFVGNDDGYFYTEFSNYPVRHYKKINKPERPSSALASIDSKISDQLNDEWNQNYGDISSLYELNWGDEYPNNNDEGWNIVRVYCGGLDEEFIHTNTIFPYKVGLKKTEWGNYYTVEQAVSEAYEFYTTNPKSSFSDRHRKGNSNTIWNQIYECCNRNEFYTIVEKTKNGWTAGKPIHIPKNKSYEEAQRVSPYENGWMHNGYYRVYIAATQEKVFGFEEKEWAISANQKNLLIWWNVGASLFFLIFIIPLWVKQYKSNRKKSESLYQRLLRLANPKNFMDNYDKEKVEKANLIYKTLLDTNPEDKEALSIVQQRAVEELGINLIDKELLEELKEKVNPQKFMSPYDPDKVALANELYAILGKEGLTYNEMAEVEEKSKTL
jgi:hypothetical protein